MRRDKLFLSGAALTVVFAVYLIFRLAPYGLKGGIIPGWHTIIYPKDVVWSLLSALILIVGLTVYLTVKVVNALLLRTSAKRTNKKGSTH